MPRGVCQRYRPRPKGKYLFAKNKGTTKNRLCAPLEKIRRAESAADIPYSDESVRSPQAKRPNISSGTSDTESSSQTTVQSACSFKRVAGTRLVTSLVSVARIAFALTA